MDSSVIGAPLSLVQNLGEGVFDFFTEPAKCLVNSPKDIGKGITKVCDCTCGDGIVSCVYCVPGNQKFGQEVSGRVL